MVSWESDCVEDLVIDSDKDPDGDALRESDSDRSSVSEDVLEIS